MKYSAHISSLRRIAFICFLLLPLCLLAQQPGKQDTILSQDSLASSGEKALKEEKKKTPAKNTAITEDVQRFLGFESPLPFRYISLPFDSIMTVNVKFFTIDLSLLLLLLFPLGLFLSFKGNQWSLLLTALMLILFLIISISTAYLGANLSPAEGITQLQEAMASSTAFWESLRQSIQHLCLRVYAPMYDGLAPYSGDQDSITYPILGIVLALSIWITLARYKQAGEEQKGLLIFSLIYGAMWLLLSPGLPWYGYLIFVLGPMLMVYAWTRDRQDGLFGQKLQQGILYAGVAIWMLSAFSLRMANYTPKTEEEASKVFYLPPGMYRMGLMNEERVLENFRSGYPKAVKLLNREDRSLVFQAGTALPYFIKKSDSRLFTDTFLEFANQLLLKYPDKETYVKVLKASGFRYMLIDLNLPNSDATPEQTLRKKFNTFMNVLYQNPRVKLLVTDRKIKRNDTGEEKYEVFLNQASVIDAGSFALYEIR